MKVRRLQTRRGSGLAFWCPGCGEGHQVELSDGAPRWTWNNDETAPTLHPSVLTRVDWAEEDGGPEICHLFLRNGVIEFLDDSTHHLAGQTVALPDWP